LYPTRPSVIPRDPRLLIFLIAPPIVGVDITLILAGWLGLATYCGWGCSANDQFKDFAMMILGIALIITASFFGLWISLRSPPPPPFVRCLRCNNPVTWITPYEKWYCEICQMNS